MRNGTVTSGRWQHLRGNRRAIRRRELRCSLDLDYVLPASTERLLSGIEGKQKNPRNFGCQQEELFSINELVNSSYLPPWP